MGAAVLGAGHDRDPGAVPDPAEGTGLRADPSPAAGASPGADLDPSPGTALAPAPAVTRGRTGAADPGANPGADQDQAAEATEDKPTEQVQHCE